MAKGAGKGMKPYFFLAFALFLPALAWGQKDLPLITTLPSPQGGETYSVSLQILFLLTVLSFLPSLLLLTTAFTRVLVVLAILRQGVGTVQTPPNMVLIGLSLFLTAFIMRPVFERMYAEGVKPYLEEKVDFQEGVRRAIEPAREFMHAQTRRDELNLFARLGNSGVTPATPAAKVPLVVLIPAFATSELKTAFQMGFVILIPFLIVDLVVASVLMSLGMLMVSPQVVSLPFKVLLFVLVDGWSLVMASLAQSFS